ncbi:MAG: methyltransferase domain-containing protein [Acidimicrobiales bacterium]|nr:methyltransferase domain-containing protein [Acidimicrobiales bacterium]
MAPFGTLPAHALAWPRPTRAALEARAAAVAHEVVGDVFDLAQLDGGSAPWPDATFDTITTVAELCRFADLSVVAGEIRDHLRDGGKLVVVEPAARAGMVATARASLATWRRELRTLHLDRDVPWELHRCGWRFFRVERDTIPAAPWSLRFIAGGVCAPTDRRVPDPVAAARPHGTAEDDTPSPTSTGAPDERTTT